MPRQGKETRKSARSQASGTTLNPDHDTVGTLAYELWRKRGCPIGSPQEAKPKAPWAAESNRIALQHSRCIRHALPPWGVD